MTKTKEVEAIIQQAGLKKKWIAQQLGLSPYGFALKLANKSDFTTTELTKLCDILGIYAIEDKERLFFATEVE